MQHCFHKHYNTFYFANINTGYAYYTNLIQYNTKREAMHTDENLQALTLHRINGWASARPDVKPNIQSYWPIS